ncbi:MAG: thioredoxin family protein [Gammaproteobacteria bacterium]
MNLLPIALLLLCLACAVPGILLLRHHRLSRQVPGLCLLLLATASGYIGIRSWQETPPAIALQTGSGQFQTIPATRLADVLASARGTPVLLDFHADWCPSCLRWEADVFSQQDIRQRLKPVTLLRIDATDMSPEVQALLQRHNIPGLPAILVFDRQGSERTDLRLMGEMSADDFRRWTDTRLKALL